MAAFNIDDDEEVIEQYSDNNKEEIVKKAPVQKEEIDEDLNEDLNENLNEDSNISSKQQYNKPGRPKTLKKKDLRTKKIPIPVSEKEYKLIRKLAFRNEMTMRNFLRSMALKGDPKSIPNLHDED